MTFAYKNKTHESLLNAATKLAEHKNRRPPPKFEYFKAPPVTHHRRERSGKVIEVNIPTYFEVPISRNRFTPQMVRELGNRYSINRKIREAHDANA